MYLYSDFFYYTAFFLGLFSSIHCLGMCSGIVIFFSYNVKNENILLYQLFYNFGRIFSYILLAFFTTFFGIYLFGSFSKFILTVISNFVLIFIGLYLLGIGFFLKKLEEFGFFFWKRFSFFLKRLLPIKNPFYGFFLGVIWGLVPCGLVYSSLLLSLTLASFKKSLLFMFFFGFGTFPSMFFVGLLFKKKNVLRCIFLLRYFFGFIIIVFAFFNIFVINDKCY